MLITLVILSVIVFSLRSLIFIIGAKLERKNARKSQNLYQPFVSIVVAARNEESNIRNCIQSLSKSIYSVDKYEIIVINDRSTDGTKEILEKLKNETTNLKVVDIISESQKGNLAGKPGAIAIGISEASGEIIMMTDADCVVNPNWIKNVVNEFSDEDVGLVASFTNVVGNRLFDRIQAIEWAYLHTMASAGIGLKQPLGCYGNNLSVRKKSYDSVGGYNKIKFSVTEDLALLQAIFHSGKKVRYLTKADADVDTLPCLTFKDYILQRHRWAVGGLALGWRAMIFVLSSTFFYLGLISAAIDASLLCFIIILFMRLFWDYVLIAGSLNILNKKNQKKWIPAAVGFLIMIEPVIPFLLLKRNVKWKNQIFKR